MTTGPRPGVLRPVVLFCALAMVAACSGGGAETVEATTTASAAVTTLPADTTSPLRTTPVRDGAEICAAFDPAEVEEVLGAPLIEPPRIDTLAPSCALLTSGGIVSARVLSEESETTETAETLYAGETARVVEFGAETETLEGLGDRAELVALADGTDLVLVRAGPVVFSVAGEGFATEELVAIAGLLAVGLDG